MFSFIDPSMLSLSSIVQCTFRVVQLRKYSLNRSPFELTSCRSCHVFSYSFALFLLLKRVKCPPFLKFTTKTSQPCPQVFSVNGALTCKNAAFLTSFPRNTKFFQIWSSVTGYGELNVCF